MQLLVNAAWKLLEKKICTSSYDTALSVSCMQVTGNIISTY